MIRYLKDTDNIVTLVFDRDDAAVNVMNHEISDAFLPVLAHLKKEKQKGSLRGIILTSAKKSFMAGGDLEYLYRAKDAALIYQFCRNLKAFFRDLEQPGIPVVAALNGSAIGTGFELALACHYRVAIDQPGIRLGLPEVQLGLIPGGGGVIRLMWLLGIVKAYHILSAGERYTPAEAYRLGLVDELASDEKDMIDRARAWLMQTEQVSRSWDLPGIYDEHGHGRIPNGTAEDPKVAAQIRLLTAKLSERQQRYPAPHALLNVLSEGSKVDFDTAMEIETRYFTELLLDPVSKNMINLFWFDYYFIKRGNNRPRGFGRFRPKKVGIIGAGQMGSGIALACARRGMEVVIKDISKTIADRGRQQVANKLDEQIQQGRILPREKAPVMELIKSTDSSIDFRDCDLVIEAVFENAGVKQKVLKEAEPYLDEFTVFASNTVSIPISTLAEKSQRPHNYVGLHFFSPADQVPLVEVVRGKNTSEETVARAFDFALAIKKLPIVVKDDWGFYANRVQNTYILEAITLLNEGYPAALIENLGLAAGMPKGGLSAADDTGLKIILKYEQQAAAHYGKKYLAHPAVNVLEKMIDELDRPGKSKGVGFYTYNNDQRQLWSGLDQEFQLQRTTYDRKEIIERFLFAQVLEALWCMQEKILISIPAANLGSVHGWGFPSYTGGVLRYVHYYGMDAFLKRCKQLEKEHGPRFKVPAQLKSIIEKAQGSMEAVS